MKYQKQIWNAIFGTRKHPRDLKVDWEGKIQSIRLKELGYQHLWDDNIDHALDLFKDALEEDKDDYLIHFLCGLAFMKKRSIRKP